MSLDWNVEKCPGFTAGEEGKPSEEFLNWRDLMVYGTMRVGLSGVTQQNLDEWEFRIEFCKKFHESFGTRAKEGGGFEDVYPDRKALEMFVGMRTNVTNERRKDWLNKVQKVLVRDCERAVEYRHRQALEEAAKEPAANEG